MSVAWAHARYLLSGEAGTGLQLSLHLYMKESLEVNRYLTSSKSSTFPKIYPAPALTLAANVLSGTLF